MGAEGFRRRGALFSPVYDLVLGIGHGTVIGA